MQNPNFFSQENTAWCKAEITFSGSFSQKNKNTIPLHIKNLFKLALKDRQVPIFSKIAIIIILTPMLTLFVWIWANTNQSMLTSYFSTATFLLKFQSIVVLQLRNASICNYSLMIAKIGVCKKLLHHWQKKQHLKKQL